MSQNIQSNPFLGLFGPAEGARTSSQNVEQNLEPKRSDGNTPELSSSHKSGGGSSLSGAPTKTDEQFVNSLIEDVFCITICDKTSKPLVFVEDTAESLAPAQRLDETTLEQALFERLLMPEPAQNVIKPLKHGNAAINHHIVEKETLTYLFECHQQLMDKKRWRPDQEEVISLLDNLIIQNVATALTEPELYGQQSLHIQFLNIFNSYDDSKEDIQSFVINVVAKILADEKGMITLKKALYPVLDEIKEQTKKSTLHTLNRCHLHVLKFFSTNETLGYILLAHNMPKDGLVGKSYMDTVFGAFLSTFISERGDIEFLPEDFQFDPTVESILQTGMLYICDSIHFIFQNLFKVSLKCRHTLLKWIGNCLHANISRGKLASRHAADLTMLSSLSNVSDIFMVNLGGVMLRLCSPFTTKNGILKLLKVDPTYCAVEVENENEADERWVHSKGMASETCLIPFDADSSSEGRSPSRPSAPSFNFVTEMFFMTHRTLDLGFRVMYEKWLQVTQEFSILQRQVALAPEAGQALRRALEAIENRFYFYGATLILPENVAKMGDFYVATAEWLLQVAIHPPVAGQLESYAPKELCHLSFPLPNDAPLTLSCVPEFLVENIAAFQRMIYRFFPTEWEKKGTEFLEPLLSLIIVFMGSKKYLCNPHLRARLAESLETLLPKDGKSPGRRQGPSFSQEALFKTHPHRSQIVQTLLAVFVSTEMTDDSVPFEQRFNYRRPMYSSLKYLWTLPEQKEAFKTLAVEAEANMSAVDPPLFLRFINLLINDAVYLLDDALSKMAELRTLQTGRDNGEWENLPASERQQRERSFLHIGQIAKFDNYLGRETIHTLEYLTSEITSIFCDPTLVDRIAAMLNYFLLTLVGPKKKNFKVKKMMEYDFKPGDLVMDISRIYINLGHNDEFCLAVSRDGRSYHPKLFEQAEEVLVRIGGGILIGDLRQVAARVAALADQQTADEAVFADAPDEFYDPLLSTLMVDPVTLPSSRTVCDRSTIARHLLSDQRDPFTKAPLTMDQVIPNVELKNRIEEWKRERRSLQTSASSSGENISMSTH